MHKTGNPIKPEILAPAGDLEKLRMAITYGADAVYLGGKDYSLRAGAGNFSPAEMAAGVDFAHGQGKRVYVTLNIFAHNQDLSGLSAYLQQLRTLSVDGVILSDPGILVRVQEEIPEIPIHLSTQANTLNYASAIFWAKQGVQRIILGRELSFSEIQEIGEQLERVDLDTELEVFVHGAMCLSYSGRCYLSRYFNNRDANQGDCSQPCRWRFALMEEKRAEEYYPVEQDSRGTYLLSSKDLCLLGEIPSLVQSGVQSFKIEGRMKSVHYLATTVRAYRRALDAYWTDPEHYTLPSVLLDEVEKASHREYTTAFYPGKATLREPGDTTITPHRGNLRGADFVGIVVAYDPETQQATVEQRGPFRVEETLEVIGPHRDPFAYSAPEMWNSVGEAIMVARHPLERVTLPMSTEPEIFSLVRRLRLTEERKES